MFKKLEDFIKDIKERDKDVPLLECSNDKEIFPEDFGCPSQPINEEEKSNLFEELGGIPAPEPDEYDEDENEEETIPSDKRRKNFFENFFQLQGFLPNDDEYI